MPKYSDRVRVTPDSMDQLAVVIRQVAEAHARLAEWMRTDGVESVDALMMKTEAEGLVRIAAFLGAVVAAYGERASMDGMRELAGAEAVIKKRTGRIREAVMLALPSEADTEVEVAKAIALSNKHKPASVQKPGQRKPAKDS